MAFLESFKAVCEKTDFEHIPPTWCVVNYLMLKHLGAGVHPGQVVIASGEASVFAYAPNDIGPMYFSTINGGNRLAQLTGYKNSGVRSTDAEEAFAFIKTSIDSGKGVAVAGPEMAVCYGYEEGTTVDDRVIFGLAKWGPGFNGRYTWADFVKYIADWGMAEGLFTVEKTTAPGSAEDAVRMLAQAAITWQTKHPAVKFGMKQAYYGLPAFRQYISDVTDPAVRETIESPYINCHALLFQHTGRYCLAQYLAGITDDLPQAMRKPVARVAELYRVVSEELRRFQDYNILETKSEGQIAGALTWLKGAYQAEEQALYLLKDLAA